MLSLQGKGTLVETLLKSSSSIIKELSAVTEVAVNAFNT